MRNAFASSHPDDYDLDEPVSSPVRAPARPSGRTRRVEPSLRAPRAAAAPRLEPDLTSNFATSARLRGATALPRAQHMRVPAMLVPFVQSPVRTLCKLAFAGLMCGIALNALLLQKGPHPHPLFAQVPDDLTRHVDVTPTSLPALQPPAIPASTMPTPAPKPLARPSNLTNLIAQTQSEGAAAGAPQAQLPPTPQAPTPVRTVPVAEASDAINQQLNRSATAATAAPTPKGDQLGALIRANSTGQPSPKSAPKLAPMPEANRVAGIQRALIKLGLSIKGAQVDGILGGTTRQAIEAFERRHNLPITGDVSPKLARLLSAESGIAIP